MFTWATFWKICTFVFTVTYFSWFFMKYCYSWVKYPQTNKYSPNSDTQLQVLFFYVLFRKKLFFCLMLFFHHVLDINYLHFALKIPKFPVNFRFGPCDDVVSKWCSWVTPPFPQLTYFCHIFTVKTLTMIFFQHLVQTELASLKKHQTETEILLFQMIFHRNEETFIRWGVKFTWEVSVVEKQSRAETLIWWNFSSLKRQNYAEDLCQDISGVSTM